MAPMKLRSYAVFAVLALVAVAHGQITLDWANLKAWSNGTVAGSYNGLSGAGGADGATNAIPGLTYNLGGGLQATVTASLEAGRWQSASVYGGYAPRYFGSGDVFAFGVSGVNPVEGVATLTITFSSPVWLQGLRIGDVDNSSGAHDQVFVTSFNGSTPVDLQATGSARSAPSIASNGVGDLRITTSGTDENTFGLNASTSYVDLTSLGEITRLSFSLSAANNDFSAHGIWLSDLTVIPEPSTYAMFLGGGVLALVVARRRFRARA